MKYLQKIFLFFSLTSCANMMSPTGGQKDVDPPKLISKIEKNHAKDFQKKIIYFNFDEFIVLNKWEENFYISPIIKKQIQKRIKGTELQIIIEDTLEINTTYYLALNNCIKDLNEGNILDSLDYTFSTFANTDTLNISGSLQDAYTLEGLVNCWVMLFNENVNDTLIFTCDPNYIAKTDNEGNFNFPNLKNDNYKIVAITEFDFIYNLNEKIAFSNRIINPNHDSIIALFAFDPIVIIDSIGLNTKILKIDSTITPVSNNNSIAPENIPTGKLEIITPINKPCILQLLQNKKVVQEVVFSRKPFLFKEIIPGKYQLKYIADNNQDSIWNTGSWENKKQAEKVINYPSEITIRANWDLELEWIIEE